MRMTAELNRLLALWVLIASITLVALPTFACDLAGPKTHVGEIKAIDSSKGSFTITDRQMKKPVTFLAAPNQLEGLSLGHQVSVKYSEAGGQLKAEEITLL